MCLNVSVAGLRAPAGRLMVIFIRPRGLILAAYLLGKKGLLTPLMRLIALYKALKPTCGFLMFGRVDVLVNNASRQVYVLSLHCPDALK